MSHDLSVCGEVRVDGVPVDIGGRLLVLLIILALRGPRGAGRGELVDILWSEATPANGTAALDPLISRLRRVAGPISGRGTVRLDPATRVDVGTALDDLDAAAAHPDPAVVLTLAQSATRTLGAPLAPACAHPWVEAHRATLRDRFADALLLAADAGLQIQPPPAAALDAARALVAARPLDERPTALLMNLLDAAGDRAAALSAYEAARQRLLAGLAVPPGPELRALHQSLLDAPAGLPQVSLPAPLATAARTPLAGRADIAAAAREALGDAALLLIEGPPGIGKTHLASLLAAERHASGATVLLARGARVSTGPFSAVAGALRPLIEQADAGTLLDLLGPVAPSLARILPVLDAGPAGGEQSDPDPLNARLRLFDAVARLLGAANPDHGVLLVVDDVQDVDPSSLQVLVYLLSTRIPRLTLLATARPGASASGDLRAAADHTTQHGLVLGPLDVAALGALVRHAHPGLAAADADALAGELHARTGGTPLLARAALAAPQRTDDLQAAIAVMAQWAGDDATRLLQVAALDDAGASLDVIASAAQLDEHRAGFGLDRARAAGLIAAGTDVVHASVREALVAHLGEAERAMIHRRLAQAYEAAGADAAPIASHWGRGATTTARARAAGWEQRAAEHALGVSAAEDAAAHARRALGHLDGADPQRRAEITLLLGRALNASSRLAEGREVLRDAQAQARLLDDDGLVARVAAEAAGHRLGGGFVDPELVALIEEGLAGSAGHDDVLRSRLAGRLAIQLLNGPRKRRDELVAEAESLARAAGQPGPIAEALLARYAAAVHLARPRERAALLDEAAGFGRAAGRVDLVLHARMLRYSGLLEAGDVAAARREFGIWETEVGAARLPYHRWANAICLPTLHLLDGQNDLAKDALDVASGLATGLGEDPVVHAASGAQVLSTWMADGRAEELVGLLSGVIADLGGAVPAWYTARAYCEVLSGNCDAALADVARIIDDDLAGLVDPNRSTALSFLADAAVLARAPEPMLATIDGALATQDGTCVVQHFGGWVHGPIAARRARIAAARGDVGAARAHADDAAALVGADAPIALSVDVAFARVATAFAEPDLAAARALQDATVEQARVHGLLGLARAVQALTR